MEAENLEERRKVRPGPVSAREAQERDELLVSVAADEFLKHGFQGATLAAISKRARISKRTIYGMFESKEALFIYVATHDIPMLRSRVLQELTVERNFREMIRQIVTVLMSGVSDRRWNALLKLAIAERDSFPSLAHAVWEHHFQIAKPLGEYLRRQLPAGAIPRLEGSRRAYHLMNLATSGYGSLLVDPATLFDDEEVWVNSVTDLFVSGFFAGIDDKTAAAAL